MAMCLSDVAFNLNFEEISEQYFILPVEKNYIPFGYFNFGGASAPWLNFGVSKNKTVIAA